MNKQKLTDFRSFLPAAVSPLFIFHKTQNLSKVPQSGSHIVTSASKMVLLTLSIFRRDFQECILAEFQCLLLSGILS